MTRKYVRISSALIFGLALPAFLIWTLWSYASGAGMIGTIVLIVACGLLTVWVDSWLSIVTPKEEMIGKIGTVTYPFSRDVDGLHRGNVQIGSESWTAFAEESDVGGLSVGRRVKVTAIDGLTLHVVPLDRA
jgi:membrane protein implicated in regulation of membrane protease activity